MFSKFFSSKSKHQDVSPEIQQTIADTFEQYISDDFPDGFQSSIQIDDVTNKEDDIIIKVTTLFPCSFELQKVAGLLTEQIGRTIQLELHLDISAVRSHGIKGVKNIIAVASGKGGVGKSTTAVNLAYALQAEGAKVGLLDADIYGPSIPTLLGLKDQKPSSSDGKTMIPLDKSGIAAMSIGFLVDESDATVWRGPMASRAFGQLLNETAWPDLDYLIIDMPPGTGDIQLTLSQSVPVAGAVIITTPQDIALVDAVKGIAMFDKVQVPVLGVIENMSYHVCDNCGHQSHLFGQGGGSAIASNAEAKLLGQLPLNINIRECADQGSSLFDDADNNDLAINYRKIAQNVASELFFNLDMRSAQTAEIIEVKEVT